MPDTVTEPAPEQSEREDKLRAFLVKLATEASEQKTRNLSWVLRSYAANRTVLESSILPFKWGSMWVLTSTPLLSTPSIPRS
jgi:hypothetical protein